MQQNDATASVRRSGSPVPDWIRAHVRGLSLCDIGGIGVNSVNERISTAILSGASEVTMIDFRPFDHPEWRIFDDKMKSLELSGYRRIEKANLEDRGFPKLVGQYDFVHATGILYHAPAPILMMDHLAKVARRFLVTGTVIVPERIENRAGRFSYPGSQILFLPGLSREERAVLQEYFAETLGWPESKFDANIPSLDDPNPTMPYVQRQPPKSGFYWSQSGDLSYSPYWSMWTQPAFESLFQMFGFRILDRHWFKRHALVILAERPGPAI